MSAELLDLLRTVDAGSVGALAHRITQIGQLPGGSDILSRIVHMKLCPEMDTEAMTQAYGDFVTNLVVQREGQVKACLGAIIGEWAEEDQPPAAKTEALRRILTIMPAVRPTLLQVIREECPHEARPVEHQTRFLRRLFSLQLAWLEPFLFDFFTGRIVNLERGLEEETQHKAEALSNLLSEHARCSTHIVGLLQTFERNLLRTAPRRLSLQPIHDIASTNAVFASKLTGLLARDLILRDNGHAASYLATLCSPVDERVLEVLSWSPLPEAKAALSHLKGEISSPESEPFLRMLPMHTRPLTPPS